MKKMRKIRMDLEFIEKYWNKTKDKIPKPKKAVFLYSPDSSYPLIRFGQIIAPKDEKTITFKFSDGTKKTIKVYSSLKELFQEKEKEKKDEKISSRFEILDL